jgi:hypothetical protein
MSLETDFFSASNKSVIFAWMCPGLFQASSGMGKSYHHAGNPKTSGIGLLGNGRRALFSNAHDLQNIHKNEGGAKFPPPLFATWGDAH